MSEEISQEILTDALIDTVLATGFDTQAFLLKAVKKSSPELMRAQLQLVSDLNDAMAFIHVERKRQDAVEEDQDKLKENAINAMRLTIQAYCGVRDPHTVLRELDWNYQRRTDALRLGTALKTLKGLSVSIRPSATCAVLKFPQQVPVRT